MNTSGMRWTAVLLTAVLACSASHAEERRPNDKKAATETQRELARDAVESATRKAVEAVLESNRLDLDIRLIGPTSVKVAGNP
jgi:uncharacterized membrane-anchored protein